METYIEQCLDSLLKQVSPDEVEVICIDDGSTDQSGQICDTYAQNYAQIMVIHTENRGVAAARNAGLEISTGRYIAWVDPDDYVIDGWYEAIRNAIEDSHPDMLVFDYLLLKNGKVKKQAYGRVSGWMERDAFILDIAEDVKIKSQMWQKICRRELFASLRFPEGVVCMSDYAILHKLILQAHTIYYLHQYLYVYRVRENSLVTRGEVEKSYRCYVIAKERYEYLTEKGFQVSQTGMLRQALACCKNYYKAQEKDSYKKIYREMQAVIRSHAGKIIGGHMPFYFRAAMCVVLSGIGPFLFIVYKRLTGRRR